MEDSVHFLKRLLTVEEVELKGNFGFVLILNFVFAFKQST